MKKILLGGATLAILSAVSAMAADVTVRAPAPAGPTPYNFSGCYIGANGGYGLGTDITDVNTSNGAASIYANAFTASAASGSFSYNATGGLAGGQIGCNYQPGRFWVIGAETDYDWAHISGSEAIATNLGTVNYSPFGPTTFGPYNNFAGQSLDSLGTARAKLGLTMAGAGMNGYADHFWVYATGGVAYGGSTYNYSLAIPASSTLQTLSASDYRIGWTVGGGIEWAIWDNWIARAEYLHVDFGASSYYTVGSGRPQDVAAVLVASYNNRYEILRFGLNYKFW
jgi:outer membrane immunogenic protein